MTAKGLLTKACHVQKDAAPKEVRDLKYIYCSDDNCLPNYVPAIIIVISAQTEIILSCLLIAVAMKTQIPL